MDYLLGTCFPYNTLPGHRTDKPWITDGFLHLIRERQRARKSGDMEQSRRLRNLVNPTGLQLRHHFTNKKSHNSTVNSLVNPMKRLFVSVWDDLPRLQSSHPIFDANEPLSAEFVISVTDTEVALEKVNNIPPWVLTDFTHILAAPVTVSL